MLTATFSTVDYIVFAIVLVLSFAIGIYHSFKHSGNNEEYLMGGRSIGIIPMAISLCASFNSAYMILGKIIDILLALKIELHTKFAISDMILSVPVVYLKRII
jgi:Na+/pantothenate symporter